MRPHSAIEFVKLSAAAVSVPASAYVVPAFGTSPYVFVLAGIGSVMSYGWDPEREANGMALLMKSTIVMLFSVALVVVLPDLADWNMDPRSEPPLAFILALYGRRIMSALKDGIPAMGRGIANMLSSRSGGGMPYMDEPPMDDPRKPVKDNPPDNQDQGY